MDMGTDIWIWPGWSVHLSRHTLWNRVACSMQHVAHKRIRQSVVTTPTPVVIIAASRIIRASPKGCIT